MVCNTSWGLQEIRIIEAPWDSREDFPPPQKGTVHVGTPAPSQLGCVQWRRAPGCAEAAMTSVLLAGEGTAMQACDDKAVSPSALAATHSSHGVLSSSGRIKSSEPQFPHRWNESSSWVVRGSLPGRRIHGFEMPVLLSWELEWFPGLNKCDVKWPGQDYPWTGSCVLYCAVKRPQLETCPVGIVGVIF